MFVNGAASSSCIQTPGSSSPGLIKLSYTARHYQSSEESGVLKQGYLK